MVVPILSINSRYFFREVLVFFTLIFFCAIADTAAAQVNACFTNSWPSELSNLPGDPQLHKARLPNGFRYVIKKNSEPEDRVAVYLHVAAGSLNETENQRGVAHFLEHMMFNGSTHFPPGSLVDYFQSIGMNFGGDTNAHTSYDQTVYNIILPDGSKKELDAGLTVMSDYAGGALLLDSEIDRERRVILAEKRARDSADYRTHIASTNFAFKGTRLPERIIIGEEQTLLHADSAVLKSYYKSWYRPENMVLIVVGDVEVEKTEELIRKHFSGLKAKEPAPQCPEFGKLSLNTTEFFYHHEPELGRTNISIETFWDTPPETDSLILEQRELLRYMGTMVMNYRLRKLQETTTPPFAHADYHYGDIIGRIGYSSIIARSNNENWQDSLTLLEKILRQSVQYGFQDLEVERAKKELLAELDENALTAQSEDSRRIGQRIIRQLNRNRVYQSPEQEKEIYGPFIAGVSANDVNREFRLLWQKKQRLVSVTGDADLRGLKRDLIADVYNRARGIEVFAQETNTQSSFPYLQPNKSPGPPQRIHFPGVDADRYMFPNGLILNVKKTEFEQNSFQVVANFGEGQLSERIPGMTLFVEEIANGSGTRRLEQSMLNNILAGSSVHMAFRIGESVFSWVGGALNKDLELYMQVLQARLFDPGFRKGVFSTAKANVALMYNKLEREVGGAMALSVQPFLASYDPHFGLPAYSEISDFSFKELQDWFTTFSHPKDLEISIVGDINITSVVQIIGTTLGGVTLDPPPVPKGGRVVFPARRQLEVGVDSSVAKSLITVAWETEDFWDMHRTRRLHMLSSILEDRLRKDIRERLGASYSPRVTSFGSRVFPNYGYITSQMVVKPGMEDQIINAIVKAGQQIAEKGITQEELERAKGPLLTSLKDTVKSNHYWLYSALSQSARYPEQLIWPATMMNDFSSVTEQELNDLARKYLVAQRVAHAKVIPGKEKLVDSAITVSKR